MPKAIITPHEARRVTTQSYNAHIEEYVDKSSHNDTRTLAYWPGVQFFLDQLPKGQVIFEIGSGTGSDALRIEEKGYRVQRSDVTEAFLGLMRSNGRSVIEYDVLDAPINDKWAAIFANAVLLHFTVEQFRTALTHIHASLKANGLFCIGMKLGDFEGWREKGLSGKRYFKFWELDELQKELADSGFIIVNTHVTLEKEFAVITARAAN